MIKFLGTRRSGRKILGLIITAGNVDKLMQDMPIHFNAEQMNLFDIKCNEVMIMYAETEEAAYKLFKEHGWIDDKTIIVEAKEKQ